MSNKLKMFLSKITDPARADEVARSLGYKSAAAVASMHFEDRHQDHGGDDMAAQIRRDREALGLDPVHTEIMEIVDAADNADDMTAQIKADRRRLGLSV